MEPLELEDLLPLEEFAARRREFFLAHMRYVDRHRRVRLGPDVTLVFENRQTLWYRLQHIIHVARLTEPAQVRQQLAHYNRLLPPGGRLMAALLLQVDETRLGAELARWRELRGDQLTLELGGQSLPADLLTCRPGDGAIGAAHWVQFGVDADGRRRLADGRVPAGLRLAVPGYAHDSGPLSDDVRGSLCRDLLSAHQSLGRTSAST